MCIFSQSLITRKTYYLQKKTIGVITVYFKESLDFLIEISNFLILGMSKTVTIRLQISTCNLIYIKLD